MKELTVRGALLDIKISNKGEVMKTVWSWCRELRVQKHRIQMYQKCSIFLKLASMYRRVQFIL